MTYEANELSVRDGSPVELYKFTYGSTVYAYTSADLAQEHESETYEPYVIARDQIRQSQESNAGNIEVSVPRDDPLAALFIPYIPSTPISLVIYRKHRLDEDVEVVVAFVGKVLSVNHESEESKAVLTCGPISEQFRKVIPIVLYQPQCNHVLYSTGCGVDREAFKVTAAIDAIDGDTITSSEFASSDDGRFRNGYVQFGDEIRWIVDHVGEVLTLMSPFQGLGLTDSVFAFPGCMRDESTCLNTYNNLDNHLGFPRIPTKNPFNTSVEF